MENIDPIFFLGPVVIVAFSVGLVAYWRFRRRLTAWVILFSLVAYFGAIAAKSILQAASYAPLNSAVKGSPWVLGPYFGLQTTFFEVGIAYLLARYAVRRGFFHANDAEGYGVSLALWENGVLIGALSLVQYVAYYAVLSGSGPSAQQLYDTLVQAAPSLFYPASSAAPLVGYSVLERVSSLLIHFSWGYLVVLAAVYKKGSFLVAALPMGLVDALVPFEGSLGLGGFEGLFFLIALASVGVALRITRGEYRSASVDFRGTPPAPGTAHLRPLIVTNFKRALSFGKVYVVMGIALPVLLTIELSVATNATAASEAGAQGAQILGEIFPLLLPVFVVLGSTGGLMIFSSDRDKGVFEYMLAYGVDVSTIFWSIIAATLCLVTLVLAAALVITVVSFVLTGVQISALILELVVLYTLPLSYAAAMFMSMAGMIWSQLTARRAGVNSPVGVAPMLGVFPVLGVLVLALGAGPANVLLVAGGASVAMILAVVLMASVSGSKMDRERFISNA